MIKVTIQQSPFLRICDSCGSTSENMKNIQFALDDDTANPNYITTIKLCPVCIIDLKRKL